MLVLRFQSLLLLLHVLTFWRQTPWRWLASLLKLPSRTLPLFELEPSELDIALKAAVDSLGRSRSRGMYIPGFIWRRLQRVVGR